MKTLFDSVTLGKLKLKNRLVRSATMEIGLTKNGTVSPELKEIHERLAKGETGLIITGMMGVGPNACLSPDMVKIYDGSFVEEFSKIPPAIHRFGAKIVVQIAHCGIKAAVTDGTSFPLGPSEAEFLPEKPAKAMTKDDIARTVRDFAKAALKCKEAGADGIQLHAAHGYLLSQFLSPYHNKRQDEYGGSIENRARIVFDVYEAVRTAVGAAYPVLIKINTNDMVDGGLSEEESTWVCQELDKRGIDAVELSGGLGLSSKTNPAQRMPPASEEGYFSRAALNLAEKISAPVITVGGYRTPEVMEQVLNKGKIAAVSLCRPLICDPELPLKWKNSDNSKGRCVSCNKCFKVDKFGCAVFKS